MHEKQTSRQRASIVTALALIAAFATGCMNREPAERLALRDLPVNPIESPGELRKGYAFETFEATALNLGESARAGTFRLGIWAENGGAISLRAGGSTLASIATEAGEGWRDLRVEIPDGLAAEDLSLHLGNAGKFGVSPCEYVADSAAERTNVLFVLIDTLRQDHVGCYGYERDTTPNIDQFREDAIAFTRLVPQSSWTKPSIASMLTSTYPPVHGAEDGPDIVREGLPSIAAALGSQGYETHGLSANVNVQPNYGYGLNFSRFWDADSVGIGLEDDKPLFDRALNTLAFVHGRPWFVYVHAMGPHAPYAPPAPFDRRYPTSDDQRQNTVNLYDGEIAYTDDQFGRIVAHLKETGQYDDTLIILTSDHGEEFWEHGGTEHGHTLYEELLRVPLLVKLPGNRLAGETREQLVEGVDLAPTILELLELPPEPRFVGQSFTEILLSDATENRVGFASLKAYKHSMRAAMQGNHKFIADVVNGTESAFDLTTDPREHAPLAPMPDRFEALKAHAARVSLQGAAGLHILITLGDSQRRTTGSISAADLSGLEVRFPKPFYQLTDDAPDTVAFDIKAPPTHMREDRWYGGLAQQAAAHLILPPNGNETVTLTVAVDKSTDAARHIHVGRESTQMVLDQQTLTLDDIAAHPDQFDPAALPHAYGVYVWYVPEAASIPPEALTQDQREALETLGYLGN